MNAREEKTCLLLSDTHLEVVIKLDLFDYRNPLRMLAFQSRNFGFYS